MPNRRRLTSDEMHVGIGMLETGSPQRNVAKHLNVSQSVVSRMWNRYQTNGNAQHLYGGGHAKATSDIQDRYIGLLARRNCFHMQLRYVMISRTLQTYEVHRKPSETICTVPA